MQISNDQLEMLAVSDETEMVKSIASELLDSRRGRSNLGIYEELRPRFYPKFEVVFMDENKVCGYTLHTGRFSSFKRENFDKNFRKTND
ncbi:hypothetical protein [Pantoea sp. App145]|uniref:hypothetical protein n=1 Tax=Pantoea sp. App145 TaxID=3071567 RepID=UPI003A7FF081